MRIRVVANQMAGCGNATDQVGMPTRGFPHQEECREDAGPIEKIEQFWSPFRMRAIVERP